MEVKKGDRILLSIYAGTEVRIDGEDYLMMREERYLPLLENEAIDRKEDSHGKGIKV